MKNIFSKLLLVIIVLGLFSSLYLYSRFTVDDAFITWRYGKNLVEHGVWDYNNSRIDPTQAYTNPIFAILSIIPPLMKWDVVLFFKIISIITYISFFVWTIKITNRNWLMTLVVFALPATVIHAFSGLETLLFVFLVSALLVVLHRRQFTISIIVTLLLFLTRPESWALLIALPLYWMFVWGHNQKNTEKKRLNIRGFFLSLGILGLFLGIYFALHIHLFGSALPNTFYVKAHGGLRGLNALKFIFYSLPFLLVVQRRFWPLLGLITVLFGGMILSYSTSDLQMNYAERFAFHIFIPSFIFTLYLISDKKTDNLTFDKSEENQSIYNGSIIWQIILGFIALIFFFASSDRKHQEILEYYPRTLYSHAAIGKVIKAIAPNYGIKAISVGDAGMIAYHSDVLVLDNIGLASTLVARGKVDDHLFEKYNLSLVILHAGKDNMPNTSKYHQRELLHWVSQKNFKRIGDIWFQPDKAELIIYGPEDIPELKKVCDESLKFNKRPLDLELVRLRNNLLPPWIYWHE